MNCAGRLLVSVIVLYYKRRSTIQETIESVLSQDYPHREIILVNNHSEDDLKTVVEPFLSEIHLIDLPNNLGACGGRNAGIRAAQGNILVFLDDDMSFASPFELSKIAKGMEQRPRTDVLAFRICDQEGKIRIREWCHPRSWAEFADTEFETHYFCEGACAFRREVFEGCGLYYERLFFGAEGHDLAVRVLDGGFRVLYYPHVCVLHRAAAEGRTSERQVYHYSRNFIWMAYKDYRLLDGIRFVFPILLMMLYFAMRTGCFRPFLKGLWAGIRGLPQIRNERTPAKKETLLYWAQLEKFRPGLLVRLARHRTTPQF